MKVSITADGVLSVKPETQIEQYALTKWRNELIIANKNLSTEKLEIVEVAYTKPKYVQRQVEPNECKA